MMTNASTIITSESGLLVKKMVRLPWESIPGSIVGYANMLALAEEIKKVTRFDPALNLASVADWEFFPGEKLLPPAQKMRALWKK